MKKVIYFFILLLISASSFSQVPQGISYQAVVRNSSNALVANAPVSAFITILKDSANGSLVYGEIDNATTNANGLFSVVIGKGQSQIGSLSNINWGSGVYYIRSAIDPAGGTNRTIVGSSQILSVPYALYAANGTANGNKVGDMQYWDGSKWTLIPAGTNGSVLTLCNGVPTWGGCGVTAVLPTVTTSATNSITSSGATLNGNVTADGGATVTSRGFCYSTTNASPTLTNSTVAVGSGTGTFSTTLSGLTASTQYYVTAYATNSVGTTYSTPISFTTLTNGANIITAAATSITSSSAILGGNIISDGGNIILSRGVCYSSTVTNPTLANSNTAIGSGVGAFSTVISGLTAGTTYYVTAYATNNLGVTTYGSPISFSTITSGVLPTVISSAATVITSSGAALNGNVTADGGATVTSRGFCYSSSNTTPTLSNSTVITSGIGTGTFSTLITGLTANTIYYVTAYATNSVGTSYSTPISFTTLSNGANITTTAASSITSYSAILGGNITSDGGNTIISRGICYSSIVANPTLANTNIGIGNGIGSFSTLVSGLIAGTTYYVTAYATNNLGVTTYGTPISFSTSSSFVLPSVSSSAATSVTSTGATLNGNVTGDGGTSVTSRGFCYSTTVASPTLANSSIAAGSGTGSYSSTLTGLTASTLYYLTAYATNSVGTSYSTPISFNTTSSGSATIITSAATSITSTSAVLGGNITNDGGYTIISRGICYSSTVASPTLANANTSIGNGTGVFSTTVNGLIPGTTYYVSAYAVNSLGVITYGTPISFNTSSSGGIGLPTVTNSAATSVTSAGASLNGNITADGGSTVISRGFCYSSTVASPTLANSNIAAGSGIGAFTANLTGLTPNTLYYVTAYATNSTGTTYSTPISFTTISSGTTFTVGQTYGGGIIFYVDNTGQHGLISATQDQSAGIQWYNGGYFVTGSSGTGIGGGQLNTTNILSSQGTGSYAAYIASQTANGYSDWFLPSKDELYLMYSNLFVKSLGNFAATVYWTSSEFDQNQAWALDLGKNSSYAYWKNNKANVRAIRKF